VYSKKVGDKLELVRSLDEISRNEEYLSKGAVLGDAVMVMAMFGTRADVVKKVLPPPLEPGPASMGLAYVAEFHRTNHGPYNEAALFISAQYKGEVGNYCLSMPVTNDMALIGGREVYGFPKKIAETIHVKREGNKVTGVCIRKGIPIITIKVNLTGPAKPGAIRPLGPNYLFKNSWGDPRMDRFDYNPHLVKQHNKIDWGKVELGEGELTLAKSKYDPISEIPVEKVLMAGYTEGMEVCMLPSEFVVGVDPMKFRPYSFIKVDWEL